MKYLFLLSFMFFSLFANNFELDMNKEVSSYKDDTKKEKLSYTDLIAYLKSSNDKNKIMILGVLYSVDSKDPDDFGSYIKADALLSKSYLEKSYKMGNPRALTILGSLILYNNNLAKIDPKLILAEKSLRQAISEGDIDAKLILANVLLIQYKYTEALDLLKDSSAHGDASSSMQLAFIYLKGLYSEKSKKMEIKKDLNVANYFLNKACSSKNKSDAITEFCYSKDIETITK